MATINDVMEFVTDNDVKFIRLQFCDIFGTLKNISIMPSELPRAFSEGIEFDPSRVEGFLNIEDSDLVLIPDPDTLSLLPWRPQQGRVVRFFCDIKKMDKTPFEADSRMVLKRAEEKLNSMGYNLRANTDCEFYLFKTNDEGEPVLIPHDIAGYCDIAPVDKGENIRRQICLTLEEMGIKPQSSQHESGPGQHEIDFMPDTPLKLADNFITFKTVVKTIASTNGLYATFMPKPLVNQCGSGLHLNFSFYKNGELINLFEENNKNTEAESFVAGIMAHIKDITAILNPIVNSYRRFGTYQAPKFVTWSHEDRSQLLRIPQMQGVSNKFELRNADPCVNLYLALSLLIYAGIDGINKKLHLPSPVKGSIYQQDTNLFSKLPSDLGEAIELMEKCTFCEDVLGKNLFTKYLSQKKDEWARFVSGSKYEKGISDFEIKNYFYKF